MSKAEKIFVKESYSKSFDLNHRKIIRFNMGKYDISFKNGLAQFSDLKKAKEIVSAKKQNVVDNLKEYLLEFETNFTNNGGEVVWAETGEDAVNSVLDIFKQNNVKSVVKSKSMTTEEIDLNQGLEDNDIEIVETDLGEYIVQIAGEKPYHIVTPAMHKSKEDVAELFNEKFGTPISSTPEELTLFVRKKLREKFINADAGISGGNFLVADIGAVALTENEGNGLMSVSMPKIHIAIVGIEKLIPSIKDLHNFWPILTAHGTGQKITAYSSVFSGSKTEEEKDGPEKMYVILLDNGRSDLYQKEKINTSLKCIRCGACLNHCPIYKNIGGYTYDAVYTGPIGSVISPHYNGFKEYKHLSYACTVCGKCTDVCPVEIDLHNLLLLNRKEAVEKSYDKTAWKIGMKGFEKGLSNRKMMDFVQGDIKNFGFNVAGKHMWGEEREFPGFAKKSFSNQWKKTKN